MDLEKNKKAVSPDMVSDLTILSKKRDGVRISDEEYYQGLSTASEDVKTIKILDRIDNVRSLNMAKDKTWTADYIAKTQRYIMPLAEFNPTLREQLESAITSVKA